jgi:putative transposase
MRQRPGPDRIAAILRAIQADLEAGLNVNQACRKVGIGQSTYYRWKALQEEPLSSEQIQISQLYAEVDRLKLLVAELALDRRMLQEALKKTRVAESV